MPLQQAYHTEGKFLIESLVYEYSLTFITKKCIDTKSVYYLSKSVFLIKKLFSFVPQFKTSLFASNL